VNIGVESVNADGTNTYTYTVGGTTAVTAGAYTAIIDFASLTAVAAVKATPTYKISTGSTALGSTSVALESAY